MKGILLFGKTAFEETSFEKTSFGESSFPIMHSPVASSRISFFSGSVLHWFGSPLVLLSVGGGIGVYSKGGYDVYC